MTLDGDGATATASPVIFKAPEFCSHDPTLWFNLLEMNFKVNRITSSVSKFSLATQKLPSEVLTKVSDVIQLAITSQQPYEDLKKAVIDRLESTVTTRLQELLSKEELGNEKPTDLLRRMKRLLSDKYATFDQSVFRQLFYQRLPSVIQANLFTVKDKLSLEELAKLADDFMDSVPSTKVAAIAPPTESTSEVQQLTAVVSQLTLQLNALQEKFDTVINARSDSPHRGRPRERPRERSRSFSRNRGDAVCFYHARYGRKAKKCVQPCDFPTSTLNDGGDH